VLETLRARCGTLLAFCLNPQATAQAALWGCDLSWDLSSWQPAAALPVELLQQLDRGMNEIIPGPGVRSVGLPFTVIAMTQGEANELVANPQSIGDELGRRTLNQFLALQDILQSSGTTTLVERYFAIRETWRPFGIQDHTIQGLIAETVRNLNRSHHPALRGRAIKVQHYPFGALFDQDRSLSPVYREITQNGCVCIVDEISLYHPRLRTAFLASPFASSAQVAMVTISPLDPYRMPPYNEIEIELSQRLAAAFDRFALDYDPQCEFSIGDERRFKRWLHSSVPHTLQTLHEPQPNRSSIVAFADELGREADRQVAGLLYTEGGVL
jgi:hypothetical protein